MVEQLERVGLRVRVGLEGWRSMVSGADTDFAPIISGAVTGTHPPADTAAIQTRWLKEARGAAFRSERYPEFAQHEQQAAAAKTVIDRGFEVVVAMGGNGTMEGIKALSRRLIDAGASEVRCFFVPVTIDGDVSGTDSIGQATAVEVGSERIRRFVADADTHQRCYVIEMMGSKSGCHALHSSIGGGGHYAVACDPLPTIELRRIATAVAHRRSTVIAVAAGHCEPERKRLAAAQCEAEAGHFANGGRAELQGLASAAKHFCAQLQSTGCLGAGTRMVYEPWSRDLRGALPNAADHFLAQAMARQIAGMVRDGNGPANAMPTFRGGRAGVLPFDELETDNAVDPVTLKLADNL